MGSTGLMGEMIPRNIGLAHLLLKEVFLMAEDIVRAHTLVREYLGLSRI